jgi:uncharacterized protein (TIGR04255 family)
MKIIKTYSEENAVKVIAFAIYFSQKLSNEDINILIKKINEIEFFNKEFNKIQNQDEIAVTFTPDGGQTQTQTINGVVCNKQTDNQIPKWSLTINKEVIVVTCREYTRWNEISLNAYNYITETFNLIPKDKDISQITLEYLDEFEILDSENNWKEILFKNDSGYITSNIYALDDFWHINQGCFVKLQNLEQKLLDTININYFSDERDSLKHKVNLRTQHILRCDNSYSYNDESIKKIFDTIHIHSKDIFEKIIHDDILNTFNRGES